jgi:hypothetical protein
MTHPNGREALPHVDTVRSAAAFPAVTDSELNRILHQRNEGEARLIATIVSWYLSTPEGRKTILDVLGTDDNRIRAIARDVYNTLPVRPHSHRAQSVTLSTYVRGLSRIGAILGALAGSLLAWWLTTVYTITTITFGTATDVHSISVTWVKVAIAVITVLGCALLGSLVGGPRRQREQMIDVSLELAMAAQHPAAPVVTSNTDGGTGR